MFPLYWLIPILVMCTHLNQFLVHFSAKMLASNLAFKIMKPLSNKTIHLTLYWKAQYSVVGFIFFWLFPAERSVILCHAFNCRNTSFPSLWAAERTRSICRGWRTTLQQWVARWHRQVKINIFITFSLLNIFPHLSVAKFRGARTFLTNDAAVISL